MHFLSLLALSGCAAAWSIPNFANLVTFGDSYTDEQRLSYFINHNGMPPPAGMPLGLSNSTSSGGYIWDRWVTYYSSQNTTLYDYAVSGAVCSNEITPRWLSSINANFPDVLGYEIPAYLADVAYVNAATNSNTLYTDREPDNTVYAMWIGTNDLGAYAFTTDSEVMGTNLTSFTECVFQAFDAVYKTGGRYFVLMNTAPLQLSPLYGLPGAGGVTASHYWPDKGSNITEISYKMMEYTTSVNTIWKYQTPYEVLIAKRYPGAHFAVYDVHSLMTDIYNNPTMYLNGTDGAANVTGFYDQCPVSGSGACIQGPGSLDGYMWYDELHPSEQVDRYIAKNFLDVVKGNSTYATYWS